MDSHWRKLKMALGLHHPSSPSSSAVAASTSSVSLSGSSSSTSSKKSCAICLEAMKPGPGRAMFTAECGHAFHFKCIAANVKFGNKVCPMCRAHWKDVPFRGQMSDLSDTIGPRTDHPRNEDQTRPGGQGPRRRHGEPRVFDDDQFVNGESIGRGRPGPERSVQVEMHPEVSAVSGSSVHNNFNALIHVKAHCRETGGGRSGADGAPRAPVDIVTVLDVSGSMAGRKIALLKQAMGFVIQNLTSSDRLSIVSFGSSSTRRIPLICMDEEGRQRALKTVDSLACNGGTNIAEGLIKGAKVVSDRKWKNPVVSVILLSDGKDTCGHSEYPTFIQEDTGRSRFQVHTFGFGADHDAELLHSIAEKSGGTFSFIESGSAIQDAFAQCIGGLLSVAAQELKVELECIHSNLRLNAIKAGSYSSGLASGARTGWIDVGDLYADEERNFLVSMDIPADKSGRDMALLKLNFSFKDPVTDSLVNVEGGANELRIQRPEKVRNPTMSVQVDEQLSRLRAAEAMAEARAAAEKGDLSRAVSVLKACRKGLGVSSSATHLCAELKEMEERMSDRKMYESSGRGYVLSGLSSHQRQRATTRGDSSQSSSLAYRTRFMSDMVARSQSSQNHETPQQHPRQK